MANCKDCICYESCKDWAEQYEDKEFPYMECRFFKPKADVVEVRHGYWEVYGLRNPQCSLCRGYHISKDNYCPNCGAKMDGERKEK